MVQYLSTMGGTAPVDFETAILKGRPEDGGLYVPSSLPQVPLTQLKTWQGLSYTNLAFEILSLFIDESTLPPHALRTLLTKSFQSFYHPDIIPHHTFTQHKGIIIQELFHGPTLSFKDVAMGFVVNLFDYFLTQRGKKMTLVVATSGDTGPAAAHACIGKNSLDAWVLFPQDLITEEQARQMTTLTAANVFAVGVNGCPDGSDDLDAVIAAMFADTSLHEELNLSSVNSINWGRVMMQMVHYFYGYLQTVDEVGEHLSFSVPSGAFGNLCAGALARKMGLPVKAFIVANNKNACLSTVFSRGVFAKEGVSPSLASAIDISVPINFWRYLYFATGQQPQKLKEWLSAFESTGEVVFDPYTHAN